MPIRPENRARYPKNWKQISDHIRFVRAGGRCEFCREAEHGRPHPVTGSRVVLTTAHLDHVPENCAGDNLAAMCQRCHLVYDAEHHARTRRDTLHRRKAIGDLFDCLEESAHAR